MAATLTVREGYYGPDFFDDLFKVDVSYTVDPSHLVAPDDFPKPDRDADENKKYTISGKRFESFKRVEIDQVLTAALEKAESFRKRVSKNCPDYYANLVGELNGYRLLMLRIDALAVSFFSHIPRFENPKMKGGQEVVLKKDDVLKDRVYYEQRMQALLAGKKQLVKFIDGKPRIGKSSASKLLAKVGEAQAARLIKG